MKRKGRLPRNRVIDKKVRLRKTTCVVLNPATGMVHVFPVTEGQAYNIERFLTEKKGFDLGKIHYMVGSGLAIKRERMMK